MAKRLMTETDLVNIPDDSCRHELMGGLLLAEPLPTHYHDRVRSRLQLLLETFVEAQALGEVFGEAGYVLARDPDTIRGPDLSFVSRQRLSNFDDRRYFPGPPDIAVEILPPASHPGEMHAKVADYLAAGARLVWVVDPEWKEIATYQELLSPRRLQTSESLDGGDVLPGLSIPLESIFPATED